MSEYPDHLNPFREKNKLSRTLRKSFREFKGFVRQSFKNKKSNDNRLNESSSDVNLRKILDARHNILRNNVMSLPPQPTSSRYSTFSTSPPLPRSRFKERLSATSLNNSMTLYDERCNPFSEDNLNPFEEPIIPQRRRSKKRAPLPPSCSDTDVRNCYQKREGSKWSLTSTDSYSTIDDKSEYSGDVNYSESLRKCLDNFNKEMQILNKESLDIHDNSHIYDEKHFENETDYMEKSNSSINSSIGEESLKEINNNERDINSSEITYELSEPGTIPLAKDEEIFEEIEQKTSVELITEETNSDEKLEDMTNENLNFKQYDELETEKNNEDEKIIIEPEYIPRIATENEDDSKNNSDTKIDPVKDKREDINNQNNKVENQTEGFRINEIKLKYIDEPILLETIQRD